MSNTVLKCSKSKIAEMEKYYKKQMQNKLPAGSIFVAKPDGCAITAYRSGKVLFQGRTAADEAKKWGEVSVNTSTGKKQQHGRYAPPENITNLSIIGSDEVGTGDYFGPITVVAAFIPTNRLETLKTLGVKDSKLLKDWQIIDVAQQIIPNLMHSLLTLDNQKYNELQQQGMSQGKMKAMLHNQALLNTLKKLNGTQYDGVLIDQFAQPTHYFNYLSGQENIVKEKVYMATKAEELHLSVAAASIVARYAFLKEMDRLSEDAGFEIPKGAGKQVDEAAARLIQEKGERALWLFSKVHFANTGKAKKLTKK